MSTSNIGKKNKNYPQLHNCLIQEPRYDIVVTPHQQRKLYKVKKNNRKKKFHL